MVLLTIEQAKWYTTPDAIIGYGHHPEDGYNVVVAPWQMFDAARLFYLFSP